MNFVNYSPWQDAAQYGAGLGNTLGQALLQVPIRKAELELQRQHYDMERNRDRLSVEMQHAHAKYYNALTAAMPDKVQAQKDREEERMLHNIAIEDYLKSKAENTKMDTASKDAVRKANIAKTNANIPYVGPLANSLIALRGLLGQAAQMRTTLAPENAATARLGANANAGLAGIDPLPNIQIPQLPQVDPMAHAVQSGMGIALPPPPQGGSQSPTRMSGGRPLTPAGMNATTSMMSRPQPSPRLRVQSKSTGRTGWATPQEIATDPDLQQIQ